MKDKITHILNGDSLDQRFPISIKGNRLVCRECFVDGPCDGETLEALYIKRANYLCESDPDPIKTYHDYSVSQFKEMQNLPVDCTVYLWFEEDLFCQTNLWFIAFLLLESSIFKNVNLVLPNKNNRFGFNRMSSDELLLAFEESKTLDRKDLLVLSTLWRSYTKHDYHNLKVIGDNAKTRLPFIEIAIELELGRKVDEMGWRRPHHLLIALKKELKTSEFIPLFKAFSSRYPEYGFGDLQVERLLNDLNDKNKYGNGDR